VNFPVGLLVAGAIAELVVIFTGQSLFRYATRYCVWFGVISAMVAATFGWVFSAEQPSTWILKVHRWLGTATAAWSLSLLVLAEVTYRSRRENVLLAFRSALLVAAMLVMTTGVFGGAMVYGIDGLSCRQQNEEGHSCNQHRRWYERLSPDCSKVSKKFTDRHAMKWHIWQHGPANEIPNLGTPGMWRLPGKNRHWAIASALRGVFPVEKDTW
jgi:uncharacterized membrane protein